MHIVHSSAFNYYFYLDEICIKIGHMLDVTINLPGPVTSSGRLTIRLPGPVTGPRLTVSRLGPFTGPERLIITFQ